VWVDRHQLVGRMQESLSTTTASGQTIGMNMTLDLSNYGPQPPPTLPPGNQVQDLGSLAAGLSGQ
jgi:hypothetical protein